MGNYTCLAVSQMQSLSSSELANCQSQDEACLLLLSSFLPLAGLQEVRELSQYKVSAGDSQRSCKPETEEIGFLCLQDQQEKLRQKFGVMRRALVGEVRSMGEGKVSSERRLHTSQLQLLCRIHDAFLRAEEREQRDFSFLRAVSEPPQFSLSIPPLFQAGLSFVLSLLLQIATSLSALQPDVLKVTLQFAANVAKDLPPMSLAATDNSIRCNVALIESFLSRHESEALLPAMCARLALSIAKGDLPSVMSIVTQIISREAEAQWTEGAPYLRTILRNLHSFSAATTLQRFSWAAERQGPDLILSHDNLRIARSSGIGWGSQRSAQTLAAGIHYVEFVVERCSNERLLLGVAESRFSNFAMRCDVKGVWSYSADGCLYCDGQFAGNTDGYASGDRIGLLVDSDHRTIRFFRNAKSVYEQGGLPCPLTFVVCIGSSDQVVSIAPSPSHPPAEFVAAIHCAAGNSDEQGEMCSQLAAAESVLASVERVEESVFAAFNLGEMNTQQRKASHLSLKSGLIVDVQPATFTAAMSLLAALRCAIEIEKRSLESVCRAIISTLRIVRNHVFTASMLRLTELESGLTAEIRGQLKDILRFFVTLPQSFSEELQSQLHCEAVNVSLHCFELFYAGSASQLDFLISGLTERRRSDTDIPLLSEVLSMYSSPLKMAKLLRCDDSAKVTQFLLLLLDIAAKETQRLIENGVALCDLQVQRALFQAQAVIFLEAAKKAQNADSFSLCLDYTSAFVAQVSPLISQLKLKAGLRIAKATAKSLEGTILSAHFLTLLRTLTVFPLSPENSALLIPDMTRILSLLSNFQPGDRELISALEDSISEVESEHPYRLGSSSEFCVAVPGTQRYFLSFDERCRTETSLDYLELFTDVTRSVRLYRWEGDNWPRAPVTVPHNSLYFVFHSSEMSVTHWGFRVKVVAVAEITVQREEWAEETQKTAAAAMAALCKNLIEGRKTAESQEVSEFLSKQLVRGGIRDTFSCRLSKSKPMLLVPFTSLIASTQTLETLPASDPSTGILKLSMLSHLFPHSTKPIISSYLTLLASSDKVSLRYCDSALLDELIAGSDRIEVTFRDLKKKAGIIGPISSLGGREMDQAERALFGVFLAFFNVVSVLERAFDDSQEVGDSLKFLLRQVNSVRQWAHLQLQRLSDASNREVTYREINRDVVEKCVLLLHTDYVQTISELGVDRAARSLTETGKMTTARINHIRRISLSAKTRSSKWKEVRKTVETITIVKRLQGLFVLRNRLREGFAADEEKKELSKVFALVMEVLNSPISARELLPSLQTRRNLATSRTLGLTLLWQSSPTLNSALPSLIPSTFSSLFLSNDSKNHYLTTVEACDPYLLACLQRSFFQLYQLLLSRIQRDTVSNIDCTSESGFSYLIDTLDALCFPFEDQDAAFLLNSAVKETAALLLSWAKGQRIFERPSRVFERNRVVVGFRVHTEEEYRESAENEAFSLNVVNRLDGEVGEEVDGQQKLALEVIRGSSRPDLLPITDVLVAAPGQELEDYEEVPGNINEVGDILSLYVKREQPCEGGSYLTKIKVTDWSPIRFSFSYKSFAALQKLDLSSPDFSSRLARKLRLKKCAWVLFKLLLYSSASKCDDSQGEIRQSRKRKLQVLFAELLFPELKCLPRSQETDTSLDIKNLLTGKHWRNSEVPLFELVANPVAEWVERIKEDAKEYVFTATNAFKGIKVEGVSVVDLVSEYISTTDPMMKGAISSEELPDPSMEVPEEYRNSRGEIDFFCFLRHILANCDTFLASFWLKNAKQSPLFRDVPKDFYEAKERLGEGSVASILSVFEQTIHPNDTGNSFLPLVKKFREAEVPGILPKRSLAKTVPKEFLNEERNIDFFAAVNSIRSHPSLLPELFQELKPLLQKYDSLPSSCSEFYKARLSPSQAEYQASLLLLLYQCCHSTGMKAILGQPHWVMELLKHMLIGSLKCSQIAFRLIREVLPLVHNPVTFSPVWRSLQKVKLRAEFGAAACKDLPTVLFCFIGIHSGIHIKSWKYTFLTMEKIAMLNRESICLLERLAEHEQWGEHIANVCLEYIGKGVEMTTGSETGSEILIGALDFLNHCSLRRPKFIPEWGRIRLQGAGITEGILVHHNAKAGTLTLFCPEDDSLHTESTASFLEAVSERSQNFLTKVPMRVVESIWAEVVKLISAFEDSQFFLKSTTPAEKLTTTAVRRLVQNCALETLFCLCDIRKDISVAAEFSQMLLKAVSRDSEFDAGQYEDLRQHLYLRHRTRAAAVVRTSSSLSSKGHQDEAGLAKQSEERRALVTTLKSIGLEYADIKEAFDHGHFDLESVLKFIETRDSAVTEKMYDNILIYRLSKNEKNPPILRDNSGVASCSETSSGHLCLKVAKRRGVEEIDEPKCLFKHFDEGVFSNVESPPEELTVLVAVGLVNTPEDCTFGFIIGKISITLKVRPETAETTFLFRMFLKFSGHCEVLNDKTGEKVLESEDAFLLEEFQHTKFGVFLNSFGQVALKGLSLFLGHFLGSPTYWSEISESFPQSFGRFLPFQLAPRPVITQALVSALGLPLSHAAALARKHPDLKRAVLALVSSDSSLSSEPLKSDFGTAIEDVVICDSGGEIPPGFTLAGIYANGEWTQDYAGYIGPLFAYKTTSNSKSQGVKTMEWKHGKVTVVKGERRLASLALVRCTDLDCVETPCGYELLCEDGLAVNLTPYTAKCHFLALRSSFYIRDFPFRSLNARLKPASSNGLSNFLPCKPPSHTQTSEESLKFASESLFQLQLRIFAMEKARKAASVFQLLNKLAGIWPSALTDGKQVATLLELSGKEYKAMKKMVAALLSSQATADAFSNYLLTDVIAQLVRPAFSPQSEKYIRKTLMYESDHPYSNDFTKIEEISLPGAQKMTISFDQNCQSEATYDYLCFCKDKSFSEEVARCSGNCWEDFEFEGDVLYWKFVTDQTNVDWGFRFTVTADVPISGKRDDCWGQKRALWVLKQMLARNGTVVGRFVVELCNSLVAFIHSSTEESLVVEALRVLRTLLLHAGEDRKELAEAVELLACEVFAVARSEMSRSEKSDFLKECFGILLEIREKFEFANSEEWFEGLFDVYSFLSSLKPQSDAFQYYVLTEFLETRSRSLDITRESLHPYSFSLLSKEVCIRNADFLTVTFTATSEAAPAHAFFVSKDYAGTAEIPIRAKYRTVRREEGWNVNLTGPDIEFRNGSQTVTRTDSSGWGSVFLSSHFQSGRLRIRLRIDSYDNSGYLYFGICGTRPFPSLQTCLNKDFDGELWAYKATGEFHCRGISREVRNAGVNTGDEVEIFADLDAREVAFSRSSEELWRFEGVNGPVTAFVCFGGNNQEVTLLSVESEITDPRNLSDLSFTVPGDRFFYHFPANSGLLLYLNAKWKPEIRPFLQFSSDFRCISKTASEEAVSRVKTVSGFSCGKQLMEIYLKALNPASTFLFALYENDQISPVFSYSSMGSFRANSEIQQLQGYFSGDCIAFSYNSLSSELKVFLNSTAIHSSQRIALDSESEYYWGVEIEAGTSVEVTKNWRLIEQVDLLGRRNSPGTAEEFGYKFTVRPGFRGKNVKAAFENLGKLGEDWKTYLKETQELLGSDVCEQLVAFLDDYCEKAGKDPLQLTAEELKVAKSDLIHYPLLEKLSGEDQRRVFAFVRSVNLHAGQLMPFVSLQITNKKRMSPLQSVVLSLRGSLFCHQKREKLREALSKTHSNERLSVSLNRQQAANARSKGLVDSQGVSSVFGQLYRQVGSVCGRQLRSGDRAFHVTLTGEGAIDAGGPYSEVLTTICEELQSKYLPLLVLSPNAAQNLGENRECWVPSPSASSKLHMDMFEFLGKVLGIAIRTQHTLSLNLPPMFWKRLLYQEMRTTDLKGVDECLFQTIDILRSVRDTCLTSDSFKTAFEGETFTTRDSAGRQIDLLPGGKSIPVTFHNAHEFADLLEAQRLNESASAYASIRKGLCALIPLNLLYTFTWKQVETLVCGAADFEVSRLRSNTVYEGIGEDAAVVRHFWELLSEMSPKERSLFLRFVWGRARLPSGGTFKRFTIARKEVEFGASDSYLPVSHTCFFTLDLPPYSSKEVLREKLLYAITHCQAIDLDRVAGAEGWEDD